MTIESESQGKFIQDNFFFLESTDLDKVESRLYGYALDGDRVSMGTAGSGESTGSDGAFVSIRRQDNEIVIEQDFMGCYGLYIFQQDGYFAISNSFWLLTEKMKKKFPLTLNRDYANHLLVRTVSSVSMEGTLINEIRLLPKNSRIKIDVVNTHMGVQYIDEKELSVPLDTKEGLQILDQWYHKWTGIIRGLKKKTNNIEVDLSGGKDSRITFALFLSSGIDMREVTVRSSKDGLHTHKEDLEIATEMSQKFAFPLNVNTVTRTGRPYTLQESLDISSMIMLGFHKEMHFKNICYDKPMYKFTGSGGESLRGYWDMPLQAFLKKSNKIASYYTTPGLAESTARVIEDSCQKIAREFALPDEASSEVVAKLFEETYSRHHFGKASIESLAGNVVTMMPLMDSLLYKLNTVTEHNQDMELIYALILDRYCPKLLDIRFDGRRRLRQETISYARQLNEQYPFVKREEKMVSLEMQVKEEEKPAVPAMPVQNIRKLADDCLWRSFESETCRDIFTRYFSSEIYAKARAYAKQFAYYPLRHVNAVLAITKAISDATESQRRVQDSIYSFFSSFEKDKETRRVQKILSRGAQIGTLVKNLITARIDIKNMSLGENDLQLECSDSRCSIETPQWFSKDGKGYQIESDAQELKIHMQCVKDGELFFFLRGRDVRDDDNVRIPVYIDYRYLAVDDEVIFDGLKEIWHDKPYEYRKSVKDGEKHVITIKWGSHGYTNMELMQLLEKCLGKE
ncbi:MAG: hypothetical protein J6N51_12575 [Selenomonas sp.]|nr:hypothetical protein [Selenomonas sp.]